MTIEQCQCPECQIKPHASDCAVHSEPAYPKGKCDCGAQPEQEPVAWMHNHIKGNVIAHRPVTLDRHPEHWTALYPEPKPCQTCEALARTVMLDQTSHDTFPPPRQPEPVIDKSAAIRIATALGWTPPRQPLTSEQINQIELSLRQYNSRDSYDLSLNDFARAIEAAHGIKGEA